MALNPLDRLVRDVEDLKRQVAGRSQLNHSSLENTAIPVYDGDGDVRLRIGAQDDGTHAIKYVQGPPPPRPTVPVVSVDGPVVRVRWDGTLLGGHIPEDFARIDVHFALASDDLEDQGAVKGNLATVAGNETVLAATVTGTYRVGLVAVSQSRARSEMSDTVEVEVTLVDLEGALNDVIDNASGGKNHYTPTEPGPGGPNDLWFDTSEDEAGLVRYTPHRWDETTQEWVSLEDERVAALAAAQEDFTADLDEVRESVDGKTTIRWSPSAPTSESPGSTPGDTWFQYGGGRQRGHWRWDGTEWVKQDFDPVMIPQLDIGTGTFGDLDGIRIKARTVSAEKLLIGSAGNTVANPGFEEGFAGWSSSGGVAIDDTFARTGTSSLRYVAGASSTGAVAQLQTIDVQAGDKFRAVVWVYNTEENLTGGGNGGFRIHRADTGVEISSGWDRDRNFRNQGPAGEWVKVERVWTAPVSTTIYFRLALAPPRPNDLWVDDVTFTPMVGSTLIEPGSIDTPHLLAGAITAESGIIASIDLGVATVGYLHGSRIEGGTIGTPQLEFGAATGDILSADALNFKTARGLDIVSSSFRAGDAVEITEDFGIRQFGPDGALNVSLPSDGSPAEFRGDLSARTLTATGRMSIQGPGAIASGGVLELESGVVPPVAGPQITNTWDRITMPPLETNETADGIVWTGGHWWRVVDVATTGLAHRLEKISPTGELLDSFATEVWAVNGLTAIGDELFLLGIRQQYPTDRSRRHVYVYGTDGRYKRSWEYTFYGTGTYQPGIGTNGTHVVIAQCWNTGELTWRHFNKTTGATESTRNTDDNFRADIAGIYLGTADFGSEKAVVAKKTASSTVRQFPVFESSAPYTYREDFAWHSADFETPAGLVLGEGGHFYSLRRDGNLIKYQPLVTGRNAGDDEDDWWCAIGWQTGTQRTPAGPATRFRYLHRALLLRQNGDVPEGVERAEIYITKQEEEPSRTDLHRVAVNSSPRLPNRMDNIAAAWDTYPNPPATNTFDTDAPGEIHSAIGTFRVDGTGAGRWGPLSFHADGTMTGIHRTATGLATVPIPTANTPAQLVVTFPEGRFTQPPAVTVSADSSVPGTTVTGVGAHTVTATSFTVAVTRTNTTATGVHWIAIGD